MTIGKPLYIYMDQNKWIDLARAYHNRLDGDQFKLVLQKIMEAVENKKAIIPLSGYHLAETQKDSSPSRRKRLAKVIATISRGWAMSLNREISIAEIQISGAKIYGYTPPQLPPIFDHGVNFALGIDLRSLIAKTINDPLATSDEFVHLFKKYMSTSKMTEFILAGLGNEESELINAKKEYEKGLTHFVEATEKFRSQLMPDSQSEAKHKKLYIANLQIVLREMMDEALGVYNKSLDEIVSMGESKLIEFIEGIPSLDVETQLVVRRNANWNKAVDKNDLADISFLTIAIPYCDIVVTENKWQDLAIRSGLDKKYNSIILSDIRDLEKFL